LTDSKSKNNKFTSCDYCANYEYDDDDGSYSCMADMDEDEFYRLLVQPGYSCPFYRNNDEYEVVKHQM